MRACVEAGSSITGERFNPCKAFPTHQGCGEIRRGPAVAALGPDMYV